MKSLYYVALFAPEELNTEIEKIKKDFCTRYQSCRALRNAAHITLVDPFSIQAEDENRHVTLFEQIVPVERFNVNLNGFGAFPNLRNPVIFIKPEKNAALLQLHHNCRRKMSWQSEEFSPHITVAYRDLSFNNFEKAWLEYQDKPFKANFEATEFQMLKHDGSKWNKISSRKLL